MICSIVADLIQTSISVEIQVSMRHWDLVYMFLNLITPHIFHTKVFLKSRARESMELLRMGTSSLGMSPCQSGSLFELRESTSLRSETTGCEQN